MKIYLALSEAGAVGLGSSQQAAHKGIEALKPDAVIMVGIAFGSAGLGKLDRCISGKAAL